MTIETNECKREQNIYSVLCVCNLNLNSVSNKRVTKKKWNQILQSHKTRSIKHCLENTLADSLHLNNFLPILDK